MKDKGIDFAKAAEMFGNALFSLTKELSESQGKFSKEDILRNGEKLADLDKEAKDRVKELNRELLSLQNKIKNL